MQINAYTFTFLIALFTITKKGNIHKTIIMVYPYNEIPLIPKINKILKC
jgi:hypothetical protein